MYTREQLDTVIRDEEEIKLSSLRREDAFCLAQIVYEEGKKNNLPICCQVVLEGFAVVRFFLEGTDARNIVWLNRKKNSVLSSGWSSIRCGMERELNGVEKDWFSNEEDYVIRGGGIPLRDENGVLLGALCISGMAHTEDHALAVQSVRKLKEMRKI